MHVDLSTCARQPVHVNLSTCLVSCAQCTFSVSSLTSLSSSLVRFHSLRNILCCASILRQPRIPDYVGSASVGGATRFMAPVLSSVPYQFIAPVVGPVRLNCLAPRLVAVVHRLLGCSLCTSVQVLTCMYRVPAVVRCIHIYATCGLCGASPLRCECALSVGCAALRSPAYCVI